MKIEDFDFFFKQNNLHFSVIDFFKEFFEIIKYLDSDKVLWVKIKIIPGELELLLIAKREF
jgi:hypothetical protein